MPITIIDSKYIIKPDYFYINPIIEVSKMNSTFINYRVPITTAFYIHFINYSNVSFYPIQKHMYIHIDMQKTKIRKSRNNIQAKSLRNLILLCISIR
jgi:hypothetical protein